MAKVPPKAKSKIRSSARHPGPRTNNGTKIKGARKPLKNTAAQLIKDQMRGLDDFDNKIQPCLLRVSDVVRGVELPSEPTDEIIRAIAHLVRIGNFPDVAARAVGVGISVYRRWIEEGLANPNSQYGKLVRAVDIADAQDEATDLQLITIGVKHWSSLAWKRERKTARRWKPKVEHTIIGTEDFGRPKEQSINIDINTASAILETLDNLGLLSKINQTPPEAPETGDPDADAD